MDRAEDSSLVELKASMASDTVLPLLGVNPCVRLRFTPAILFEHLIRGHATLGGTSSADRLF